RCVEGAPAEPPPPADAIPPRRRTEQHDEVSGPSGGRPGQEPLLEQPDRHDVDERGAGLRGVEDELPPDRRNADAVAVAADAPHDAIDEVAGSRVGRIAE